MSSTQRSIFAHWLLGTFEYGTFADCRYFPLSTSSGGIAESRAGSGSRGSFVGVLRSQYRSLEPGYPDAGPPAQTPPRPPGPDQMRASSAGDVGIRLLVCGNQYLQVGTRQPRSLLAE